MKQNIFNMLPVRGAIFLLIISLCSCSLFAKDICPYIANGKVRIFSETNEFEAAGLDLYFFNKSKKNVKNFTIVFFLFDDGEPISNGRSNFVFSVSKNIDAGQSLETCISLDSYFSEIPEYPYEVDYLYISKVEYEDGTIWTDPLGLHAF